MSLNRCEDDGQPGWKWGESGACYTYTAGDDASETAARKKAMAQAAAMGEFPGTGQQRSEIITRSDSIVLADQVDFRQRLIDVIAVPYEQETEVLVRGEMWREVFDRRAFDGLQDHAGRIPVNREHVMGQTFGKVVGADPFRAEGLVTTVRVAKTPLGDETLQLAAEDMLGASVGYYVKKPSDVSLDRKIMHRRVKRAFLRHLSLVESPAYAGATVLAVRDSDEIAPGVPVRTPTLDEFVNDDVFMWANSRLRAE